jgi:hypothetical protein
MRVFPRRTNATPDDDMVRVGCAPGLFDQCDEVHVSVTWTWDMPLAERLAEQWRHVAPVRIGGPATGARGEEFIPGMYVKHGYVITSRGCPNRCWFCSVWRREGNIRELPITDGWNVLDDNLLACGDAHISAVFDMLSRQSRRPEFTGGLEAARLQPWMADRLKALRPKQLFFAYDTPDDYEPLVDAGKLLLDVGFTTASHALRCYVLCGYPKDTIDDAETRMRQSMDAGFTPMAMLWRDEDGKRDYTWRRWARTWARPAMIAARVNACI